MPVNVITIAADGEMLPSEWQIADNYWSEYDFGFGVHNTVKINVIPNSYYVYTNIILVYNYGVNVQMVSWRFAPYIE